MRDAVAFIGALAVDQVNDFRNFDGLTAFGRGREPRNISRRRVPNIAQFDAIETSLNNYIEWTGPAAISGGFHWLLLEGPSLCEPCRQAGKVIRDAVCITGTA